MVFTQYKWLFHKLIMPEVKDITSFCLNPSFLEKQMVNLEGAPKLDNDVKIKKLSDKVMEIYSKRVPGYGLKSRNKLNLRNRLNKIYGPCSMLIKNPKHLMQEVSNIYQINHAHYLIALREMKNFPDLCCVNSSCNTVTSAWKLGNFNMAYVWSKRGSHGYNVSPFVMKTPHIQGVVISDPTSNQLWSKNSMPNKPKNLIFIVSNSKWDYKTEFNSGVNLYPSSVFHIGLVNSRMPLGVLRPTIAEYLEKAFDNPINLNRLI